MQDISSKPFLRPRFDPIPPKDAHPTISDYDDISSLTDLIRYNSKNNNEGIFCKQAILNEELGVGDGVECRSNRYSAHSISYGQVYSAVQVCADRIARVLPVTQINSRKPVALYMESDVGLFIHLAALMELGIPLLLLSARLGSPSVAHLLRETGASAILVTKRTKKMLQSMDVEAVDMTEVPSWHYFLDNSIPLGDSRANLTANGHAQSATTKDAPHAEENPSVNGRRNADHNAEVGALILHSSGTTGLPKPIYLAPRYVLGYAACHEIGIEEACSASFSTLPLYHGFGLLAPCLSLSIGMTCCFPPASIIPAGRSTAELLQLFTPDALLTVPSIIEDLLNLPDDEKDHALDTLRTLGFIAVGGGALRPDIGELLVEKGIKLVNHYGVTEIGAIAPVFRPGPDYDHRYLRLREDLGLRLQPIPCSDRFKLIGYPVGWDKPFEVQDELERNAANVSRLEVKIIGRMDDVIVLKSGEKVMPRLLETSLMADPEIQTAVCVGSGAFEVLVIVEPSPSSSIDMGQDTEAFKSHVWSLVKSLNETLDQHGRVSSMRAIIVKPPTKTIPRSDKGSVMRREVGEQFREEIEVAYAELEADMNSTDAISDISDVLGKVQKMVREVAGNLFSESPDVIDEEEDFFERGMDSLQCVRLARLLNAALRLDKDRNQQPITKEFVYANPCIRRLAEAVTQLLEGKFEQQQGETDEEGKPLSDPRLRRMRMVLGDSIREVRAQQLPKSDKTAFTVLVTGATGNLGAHVLSELASNPLIKNIICLVRGGKGQEGNAEARVQTALGSAGLNLGSQQWSKIKFEQSDPSQWANSTSCMNDDQSSFNRIAADVTHVIHLAWPMDFHRTLESFRPQLRTIQGLIQLSRIAHKRRPASPRVRIVFASSIATVRNYWDAQGSLSSDGSSNVPEAGFPDPSVATPMGYAEAKWVGERLLEQAGQELSAEVEPVVVRIGQLSGPESCKGVWKSAEHIPALVKASQVVGAMPALAGAVSWLPVDRAAKSLVEMTLHVGDVPRFLHLENPVRQPTADISTFIGAELGLPANPLPFEEWLQKCLDAGMLSSLEEFFKTHFRALASGSVVLDTEMARAVSATLRGSGGVPQELIKRYVARWREEGFLE